MYRLRKNYQRRFNRIIRKLNHNIANDELWKGRFEFRQKKAEYEEFADGSGAMMHFIIRGYDKATGFYKDFRIEYAPWLTFPTYRVWEAANEFIVNDSCVWDENPRVETTKDYTHVHMPDKVMNKDWNFHLSYKFMKGSV